MNSRSNWIHRNLLVWSRNITVQKNQNLLKKEAHSSKIVEFGWIRLNNWWFIPFSNRASFSIFFPLSHLSHWLLFRHFRFYSRKLNKFFYTFPSKIISEPSLLNPHANLTVSSASCFIQAIQNFSSCVCVAFVDILKELHILSWYWIFAFLHPIVKGLIYYTCRFRNKNVRKSQC